MYVRFKILTAAKMSLVVLLVVMPVVPTFHVTLKMDAVRSYGASEPRRRQLESYLFVYLSVYLFM